MIIKQEDKIAYKVAEIMFLVVYAAILAIAFIDNVNLKPFTWFAMTEKVLMVVAFAITVFRFAISMRTKEEILPSILCVVVAMVLALSWVYTREFSVLLTAVLLVCCKDIDYRELLRVPFALNLVLILGTILSGAVGILDSTVVILPERIVASFGFVSTDKLYLAVYTLIMMGIVLLIPYCQKAKSAMVGVSLVVSLVYCVLKYSVLASDEFFPNAFNIVTMIALAVGYGAAYFWLDKHDKKHLAVITLIVGVASIVGGTVDQIPLNVFLLLGFSQKGEDLVKYVATTEAAEENTSNLPSTDSDCDAFGNDIEVLIEGDKEKNTEKKIDIFPLGAAIGVIIGLVASGIVFKDFFSMLQTATDIRQAQATISAQDNGVYGVISASLGYADANAWGLWAVICLYVIAAGMACAALALIGDAIHRAIIKVRVSKSLFYFKVGAIPAFLVLAGTMGTYMYLNFSDIVYRDETVLISRAQECGEALFEIAAMDGSTYTNDNGFEATYELGQVYAEYIPDYFAKMIPGVEGIWLSEGQYLADKENITIITTRDKEYKTLIANGFEYAPISQYYAIYTNDEVAKIGLSNSGNTTVAAWTESSHVDLVEMALLRQETITPEGYILLGDDTNIAYTIGPYVTFSSGEWSVIYRVKMVSDMPEDPTQSAVGIYISSEDVKYARQILTFEDFDEEGYAKVELTLGSPTDILNVEFNVHAVNGILLEVHDIEFKKLQ